VNRWLHSHAISLSLLPVADETGLEVAARSGFDGKYYAEKRSLEPR
jgi:hypothetical protein